MLEVTDPVTTASVLQEQPQKQIARRRRRMTAVAVLLDAILIMVGFSIAYHLRYSFRWPAPFSLVVREVVAQYYVSAQAFFPYALILLIVLLALFAMKGLYRLSRSASILDHMGIIISSVTTGIALLIVIVFLQTSSQFYSRLIFAFAWATIILLLSLWRMIYIWVQRWRWAQGVGREPVLVVGGKGLGRSVMESIVAHPFLGYHLVGFLEDEEQPTNLERPNLHFRHIGKVQQLEDLLKANPINRVFLALPFWEQYRLPELVEICHEAGVPFRVVPDLYHLSFDQVNVDQISGLPLIDLRTVTLRGWNLWLKRMIDLAIILIASPFVLLLVGIIALVIRLDSAGPIFFRQIRAGKNGKPFTTYKFRTMTADAEARKAQIANKGAIDQRLFKVRDDPRQTRVGRFLRRTSMDEIPQLWNVLLGDMSLVGPRPQVLEEVAQYDDWHHRRLEVMPGMTGLWQVLGRSDTSFDEMVRLDIYYAEHWSLSMDLRILIQTIPAVLSGRGAY